MSVIDEEGFRSNVGIVLTNHRRQLFWGRRLGQSSWQFPQGGLLENEAPEQALFRELKEEVGLEESDVDILGCSKRWLTYRLPQSLIRQDSLPLCVGQKQKWFLLRLCSDDSRICLDHTNEPEFDHWRWVSYWFPLKRVVEFKRRVYRAALEEFAPLLFTDE